MEGCFPCQEMAVKNEVGLLNNPLKISWLEGQPRSHPNTILPDSTSHRRTSQVRRMGCGVEIWCSNNLNLSVFCGCGQIEALGARPGFPNSLSVLDQWLSKGPLVRAAAHWELELFGYWIFTHSLAQPKASSAILMRFFNTSGLL